MAINWRIRPTRREDIMVAAAPAEKQGTHHATIFAQSVAADGEWFDFGEVDMSGLQDPFEDATSLVKGGFFIAPYDRFAFRARFVDEDGPIECVFYAAKHPSKTDVLRVLRVTFYMTEQGQAAHTFVLLNIATKRDATSPALEIGVLEEADVAKHGKDFLHSQGQIECCQFLALWMILNTKGVTTERVEPSAALQRSRSKHGKTPLLPVTHVRAKDYLKAARSETEKGGSPRPHLRRAHIRNWFGRMIPVSATIVNAKFGPAVSRDHYKVANP